MWLKIASNQMDIFQDSLYYLGLYKAKSIKLHHFSNAKMYVYAPQATKMWSLFSYHDGFPRAKRKLLILFWQNVLSCLSFPFWSNIAVDSQRQAWLSTKSDIFHNSFCTGIFDIKRTSDQYVKWLTTVLY